MRHSNLFQPDKNGKSAISSLESRVNSNPLDHQPLGQATDVFKDGRHNPYGSKVIDEQYKTVPATMNLK